MQEVINTICIIVCIMMIIRILYPLCIGLIFILLIELNFRIYKRRCNKFLELAKKGICHKEEFNQWFNVESKAYCFKKDNFNKLHDMFIKSNKE